MKKNLRLAIATCAGCTLMLLVTTGIAMNVFSTAQPYILAQNGFSNTQTSLIVTVRSVLYLLCMLGIDRYYRLLGERLGCALACLLAAASFAVFAVAKSLPVYYLGGALAGISCGLGSMVPATLLIHRWLRAHRGLALGICAAGSGLATVVFCPILTELIERSGLHVAFWWTAGFCALCALMVFLLVRPGPEQYGLEPFGEAEQQAAQSAALHTFQPGRVRWVLLVLAVMLVSGICSNGFTHMMVLYTTAGMEPLRTAAALSVCGLALMVGKCVFGELSDALGSYRANYLMFAILMSGALLCVLSSYRSVWLMFASAVLFGFGASLNTVGITIWATDLSTPERRGTTLRLFQAAYGAGCVLVSFLPGVAADLTGSYAPAYALFVALLVFCLIVLQSTYRKAAGHRK